MLWLVSLACSQSDGRQEDSEGRSERAVTCQIGARSDVNTSEQDLAHDRLSSIGKEILAEPTLPNA